MRTDLIPREGQFYKANLHCHTTVSDGHLTPEETRDRYMEKGYSVVAFSDHRQMLDHSELNREDFLALTSFEMDFTDPGPHEVSPKTCHFTCICPHPHRELAVPNGRPHNAEAINRFVRELRDEGFLVTYNHPQWSLEDEVDYLSYPYFTGMEIYNNTCIHLGYHEENAVVYTKMLRKHGQLHAIAADDNHAPSHIGGGWVMIKAPHLSYADIFSALREGQFYASYGAVIDELYLEDGLLHLSTPGAAEIAFFTGTRMGKRVFAEGNRLLTHASYAITGKEGFVYAEVTAPNGKRAYTNALFVK